MIASGTAETIASDNNVTGRVRYDSPSKSDSLMLYFLLPFIIARVIASNSRLDATRLSQVQIPKQMVMNDDDNDDRYEILGGKQGRVERHYEIGKIING